MTTARPGEKSVPVSDTNHEWPAGEGGEAATTHSYEGVAEVRRSRRAAERHRALLEWVVAVVLAVVVALAIKAWVAQTFVIPSGSMENTLLINDRVLVSKLSYRIGDVSRGDVVVFDNPECRATAARACEYAELIKRVVGLGGDEVTTRDGRLVVNGEVVDEPYLKPGSTTLTPGACTVYDEGEVISVPMGEMLVMGDNRNLSKDGRCFGPVSVDAVVGKAFLRVWPLNRIGGL